MNKVRKFAAECGIKNVLLYANAEESCIFKRYAESCGYERKTTFFSDLSLAEWYGLDSVRDTYKNVVASWLGDVVYFTEFVMCLNWKIWEWNARGYEELAMLYNELWIDASNLAVEHFKGKDLDYFYSTLD